MDEDEERGLEPIRPAHIEVLPAVSQRSRIWPLLGSALVWAARELLPPLISAWRVTRIADFQPIQRRPAASNLRLATGRRHGRRRRWGRA